jgi:hypothetical protein
MHAQTIEFVDLDPRMHAVEKIERIVAMRQLQIIRGEVRGAALDPVEACTVVRRRRDKAVIDEAAGERLLLRLQEGGVDHAKNSRTTEQI